MTDQTTPMTEVPDPMVGIPLGDALRDIATTHGYSTLGGWNVEALATRADILREMVDGIEDEPTEVTPVQCALLEAFQSVALDSDAPAAEYAGKQLARMAGEAFGYPPPAPIVREGGVAGFLYGRPIVPSPTTPVGTAPVDHLARQQRATGGVVKPRPYIVGEQSSETTAEPWPFAPGTVIRDEDGAEEEWFSEAPVGTVIRDEDGHEQEAILTGRGLMWMPVTGVHSTPSWIATASPWTVVSVPEQESDRG